MSFRHRSEKDRFQPGEKHTKPPVSGWSRALPQREHLHIYIRPHTPILLCSCALLAIRILQSSARRHFRTSSEETETESVESDPLDNNGSIEAPLSGCEPVKQTQRVDGKDQANTGEVILSFDQYRAEETQKTRKSPIITPAPSRTVLTRARSTPNPLIFQNGSQTPPSKSRTMHLRRPRRPKHRRTGSFRAAARAARHGRQGESPGDGYKTEEDSDGPTDPRSMFRSSNSAASVFSSITLGSEVESMDRTNSIDSPLDAPRLSIASPAGDQGARTHSELPDRSSEPVTPQSLDNARQLSNQRTHAARMQRCRRKE